MRQGCRPSEVLPFSADSVQILCLVFTGETNLHFHTCSLIMHLIVISQGTFLSAVVLGFFFFFFFPFKRIFSVFSV